MSEREEFEMLFEGRIVLKGGHLVDPASGIDEITDIRMDEGIILAIQKDIHPTAGETVIPCDGQYIFPGFVDLHVHFRDPGQTYKETLESGARAAAAGGFTAVCPMPNTVPATDSLEKISLLLKRSKEETAVNILPISAVTIGQEGKEIVNVSAVKLAGAVALSEDGKSVMDTDLYEKALRKAKEEDIPVFAHCEDKSILRGGVINAGKKAEELGLPGISDAVEDIIAARDLILAGETGAHVHLCHCSTKASVAFLMMAKQLGYPVSAEACPHHFALCDEDIPFNDGNYKMNPPLRSREDMMAIREGLKRGIIDCIATDHAPHSEEEKANGFGGSPFGITGLETAFAVSYTTLCLEGGMKLMDLIRLMSLNPSKIIKWRGGSVTPGKPADLCVCSLAEFTVDKNAFVSKGHNTPFHGKKLHGKVMRTFVGGKQVYQSPECEVLF